MLVAQSNATIHVNNQHLIHFFMENLSCKDIRLICFGFQRTDPPSFHQRIRSFCVLSYLIYFVVLFVNECLAPVAAVDIVLTAQTCHICECEFSIR